MLSEMFGNASEFHKRRRRKKTETHKIYGKKVIIRCICQGNHIHSGNTHEDVSQLWLQFKQLLTTHWVVTIQYVLLKAETGQLYFL